MHTAATPQSSDTPVRAAIRKPGARIAPASSAAEREADRIAAAVVGGTSLGGFGLPPAPERGVIRRSCAACAAGGPSCPACGEEEATLHLARAPGTAAAPGGEQSRAARAASAVAHGGEPLPHALAGYFEPRFGADLSHVRLHTDPGAGDAAQGIGARAFALGSQIAFAPGAYRPASPGGRRLIAHELAHVLRHNREAGGPGVIHCDGPLHEHEYPTAEGTVVFQEQVAGERTTVGGRISGTVRRRQLGIPEGSTTRRVLSYGEGYSAGGWGDAQVTLDTNSTPCEVHLPYVFRFRPLAASGDPEICADPTPPAPPNYAMTQARANEIGDDFVGAIEAILSRQFTVRISGCDSRCANQDIPIVAQVSREGTHGTTSYDRLVHVVPRGGRGDAGTICAGRNDSGVRPGFAAHESGHQLLRVIDEYRERSEPRRQAVPETSYDERVQGGYSYMGAQSSYGRLAVFHPRHFEHVAVFLRDLFPGCTVALQPAQPLTLDYRAFLRASYARIGGEHGWTASGGVEVGVPITRDRAWALLLSAHASYLETLTGAPRQALLSGLRMGLERRFSSESTSGTISGRVGGGVLHEFDPSGYRPTAPRTGGFVEAEISGGVTVEDEHGFLNVTLGGGTEISSDPEAMRWFRAGIEFGLRF